MSGPPAAVAPSVGAIHRNTRPILRRWPRTPARHSRPSTVTSYSLAITDWLAEDRHLPSLEVLHRLQEQGYAGGKSAVAQAILDRVLERGHLLELRGPSYRTRDAGSSRDTEIPVIARYDTGRDLLFRKSWF